MRRLVQPSVLKSALVAAVLSAWFCYPRISLWLTRPYAVWYLEIVLFLGAAVLWGFVFAWHTHYTQRPVFAPHVPWRDWAIATVAGLLVAAGLHLFLDPSLRAATPEDYPTTLEQWVAMTLFDLAFVQLLLIFAPFAWLMRLLQNRRFAFLLTVLFGLLVLGLKITSSPRALPAQLAMELAVVRIGAGWLGVSFYLRGGVGLVSWWSFLVGARHLLELGLAGQEMAANETRGLSW